MLCQPFLGLLLLLVAHLQDNLGTQVIDHIGNLEQILLIQHVQNTADMIHII